MTGNHDRLTELHQAHYADLVRYFVRRGGADDADDLAAEVFIIAWGKLPADLDNPRPWLFGVARKVLGNSRRTHERRMLRLREAGLPAAALARLHSPIGLDLGASSPAETAVSILAEVLAVRSGASGRPLGSRPGPIHPTA